VRSISEAKPVSNSPGKGCTSGVFTSARLTGRGRLLGEFATKSAYESGGPTGLLRLQEATQRPEATVTMKLSMSRERRMGRHSSIANPGVQVGRAAFLVGLAFAAMALASPAAEAVPLPRRWISVAKRTI
jgi:hypothetical protein